ncbi:MAG TPA: DUF3187 family protein [Thermoanaerobaculia bacterium]|nr:DUF3187 family protein [Thermoanaerobaculia bacterium]
MNRHSIPRAVAAVILVLLAGAACAQEISPAEALREPLPVRDQFLLGNGFLSLEPTSARVLPDGAWLADIHFANANTFARSEFVSHDLANNGGGRAGINRLLQGGPNQPASIFLVDGEVHRLTMSLRRGIGDRLEVGISIPITSNGGGWMDKLIEDFHKGFGLGNAERQFLPRNSEIVYVRTPKSTYLRQGTNGYELGDVALTAKYGLARFDARRLALAVEGVVTVPTGHASTLNGSGSVDAAINFIATKSFSRTSIHESLGIIRLGADKPLGTSSETVLTDTLGVTQLVKRATSLALQITFSQTPFRQLGFPEWKRHSSMLSAGVQHRFGASVVHLALIENLFTFNNAADFGMQCGIARRF